MIKGSEYLEDDDRHTEGFRSGVKTAHKSLKVQLGAYEKQKSKECKEIDGEKVLELLRNCKEGDTIVWDEANGEVYKIKLEKKYPK